MRRETRSAEKQAAAKQSVGRAISADFFFAFKNRIKNLTGFSVDPIIARLVGAVINR
jgi:hypothetical protein